MAFKIEKTWLQINPTSIVKRKESSIAISDLQNKNEEQKNNQQSQNKEERKYKKEELEQAAKELSEQPFFINSGIKIEIIPTKNGFVIQMLQSSGALVRSMSAEEFMQLHLSTKSNIQGERGNILDKKY